MWVTALVPVTDLSQPTVLAHAPEELTRGRLRRIGEGIGKVVYASEHWVVKRERTNTEIIALIALWKLLRKLERLLPKAIGKRLVDRPARQIRFMRVLMQAVILVVPRSLWFMTHIGDMWRLYVTRDERGEKLAHERLLGTKLIPEKITFPPVRVHVGGWLGWLEVSEAAERVETTLLQRISDAAQAGLYDQVEDWLQRFLDLRQNGWRRGLFSVDAHLKNFGVTGDRVVLLDAGGLTDRWEEIEKRLAFEAQKGEPHARLGLGPILADRPDIAQRFNDRWRATVNVERVLHHWPSQPAA